MRLSFDFPFYGHLVRNITIATGGFLYTGEYVHSWLAATQYIAPLMANFDTSLSNDSFIKYLDNGKFDWSWLCTRLFIDCVFPGTAFTVQWENVSLQDKPAAGNFTFQTTLYKNGDIVFVYENIPITIENIQDDHHPVKVGLSDAYISDRTIFFVRRKTIYEYHRVHFSREDIKNWTSIYLSALPTCLSFKDCTSCVTKFADLKVLFCLPISWWKKLSACSSSVRGVRALIAAPVEWIATGKDGCPAGATGTRYKKSTHAQQLTRKRNTPWISPTGPTSWIHFCRITKHLWITARNTRLLRLLTNRCINRGSTNQYSLSVWACPALCPFWCSSLWFWGWVCGLYTRIGIHTALAGRFSFG